MIEKQEIIDITNKLYKLTLLFPKKEPLRYKMREVGDRILESATILEVFHNPILRDSFLPVDNLKKKDLIFELISDLDVIISYFEVAKYQNWVSYFDILEIKEKYDKIKDNLIKDFNSKIDKKVEEKKAIIEQPVKLIKEEKSKDLDSRKEKILNFLKEKKQIQVWEVKELLPDVSKRTLRRDFEHLLKLGLVQRIGERNETFYKLS
jgi:hypothetical protein